MPDDIYLSKTKKLVCSKENCNCDIFIKAVQVRKIPRLLSKTGKDEFINLESLICFECDQAVTPKELNDL